MFDGNNFYEESCSSYKNCYSFIFSFHPDRVVFRLGEYCRDEAELSVMGSGIFYCNRVSGIEILFQRYILKIIDQQCRNVNSTLSKTSTHSSLSLLPTDSQHLLLLMFPLRERVQVLIALLEPERKERESSGVLKKMPDMSRFFEIMRMSSSIA